MPTSLSALQQDHIYPGYVVTVTAATISVRFLGRDRLLVLRKELSAKPIKKASEVATLGQSVVVRVVMGEKGVNGSLKCAPSEEQEALLVASYQEERLRLLDSGNYEMEEEVASSEEDVNEEEKEEEDSSSMEEEDDNDDDDENDDDDSSMDVEEKEDDDDDNDDDDDDDDDDPTPFQWNSCPIGTTYEATIRSLRPYGAVVELSNGMLGFAQSPIHTEGVTLVEGAKVTARVLDVNPSLELFDVTLNSRFLATTQVEVRQRSRKMSDCEIGLTQSQKVEACILLVKESYLIASMPSHNHDLLLIPTRSYNTIETVYQPEVGTALACDLVTESGIGSLIVERMNAFKGTVEEDQSDLLRAFFAGLRVGRLNEDVLAREVAVKAMEQGESIQLGAHLIGQTMQVRVKSVQGTRMQVTLANVRTDSFYRAFILACDLEEEDVLSNHKEGDMVTAK